MEQRSLISSCMEDTANKKPRKECKAPPMVARLLTGLFLFCDWLSRGRKEKCVCSTQKIFKGHADFYCGGYMELL